MQTGTPAHLAIHAKITAGVPIGAKSARSKTSGA